MIPLVVHLAWPIALAAVIGLVSGAAVAPRGRMGALAGAALVLLAGAAGLAALGLAPGRNGLRLEIGVVLAGTYAAACLVAALARRLFSRG